MPWFVDEFAPQLYGNHNHHYMLPALYGGPDKPFAMVVLEGPSISFTQERWPAGVTEAQTAINTHRQIFLNWVNANRRQREVFKALVSAALQDHLLGLPTFNSLNSTAEFFKTLYVTDVWKCGRGQCANVNWIAKITEELDHVGHQRVLLVGAHAQQRVAPLCQERQVPYRAIPFPSFRNDRLMEDAINGLQLWLAQL